MTSKSLSEIPIILGPGLHQISAVQVPGGPVKDSKGLAVQSTGRPKKSYEEVHGKVQSGFLEEERIDRIEHVVMQLVKKRERKVDMFVCTAQFSFNRRTGFCCPQKVVCRSLFSNMFSRASSHPDIVGFPFPVSTCHFPFKTADTHVRINSLDSVKLYCYTIYTPGSK